MTKRNRRNFLKSASAVSAGALIGAPPLFANENTADSANASESAITRETFVEADKLTGVPHTDSERDMMIESIEHRLEWTRQIRELGIKNDYAAPATVFNPRLPETKLPPLLWNREVKATPPLPVKEEDIAFAPIGLLSEWVRTGKLKSRTLTEIYLKRLKQYSPRLECMVTITSELARQQADRADKEIADGLYRGALHGIPFGAKDLFDSKGIRTTWGAMPYKDRIARQDAAVIEKLKQAGAVLLGKTTLGALAYGDLWFDGLTRNPWNTEEGSSGSSAGSASAVAAGLMPFALGTETLGSIESPASRNGVVGLRPTFGRVSRHGAMVLCWSLDKVGALCRSVEDSIIVLDAINGYDSRDASSIDAPIAFDNTASITGAKIAYDPEWFGPDTSAPLKLIPELAKELGFELVKIKLPDLPYRAMISILEAEAAAAFDDLILDNRDDLLRAQTPRAWPNSMRQARYIPAVDLIQAQRFRRQTMQIMQETFAGIDAVMGPGISGPGQGTVMSVITNFTGHPSLTIRAGFIRSAPRRGGFVDPKFFGAPSSGEEKKVPVSLTLWGPLFEEGKLCQVGMAIEEKLAVQQLRPPGTI